MRIFSKRAFQFDHPAGSAPAVVVQAQSFADVPDWVEDSVMFRLASADETVLVIDSKAAEIAAETGTRTDKRAEAKAKAEAEAKAKAEAEAKAKAEAEAAGNQ